MSVLGWRNLTELQWRTLDESHWRSLVEQVIAAVVVIEGTSSFTAFDKVIAKATASLVATSSVSASGRLAGESSAHIVGAGTVTANGHRVVRLSSTIVGSSEVTSIGRAKRYVNPYAYDLGVASAIYPLGNRPKDTKHIEINFIFNDTKYDKLYYDEFKKKIVIEYKNAERKTARPKIKLEKIGRVKRGPKVHFEVVH